MILYARKYILAIAYLLAGLTLTFSITWLVTKIGWFPAVETRNDLQTKITSTHFFFLIVFQLAGFILPAFLFARFKNFNWFPVQAEIKLYEVIMAFLALIALNIIITVTYKLMDLEVKQFEDFNKDILRQRPLTFLVTVSLLVPFYEEVIFRGIVLGTLWPHENGSLAGKISAIFFTSLFFMMPHLEKASNWMVLPPVFVLSIFLCLLTVKKRGILLSIIVHSLQNFLAGLGFLLIKSVPT